MIASIQTKNDCFKVDLSKPVDISIPISTDPQNASAWYVEPARIEPVRTENFTGSVAEGGSVNFRNIFFNPHGNGCHTECVGHISTTVYSINQHLKQFFFEAQLASFTPEILQADRGFQKTGDGVITLEQVKVALGASHSEAVVIRTLPNAKSKTKRQYSQTNPPYLDHRAAQWLRERGVKHLLIDLPSVDRENDDGRLLAHHQFWNYPKAPRFDATITEFIFVPDAIADGAYLLNLQIASFENDAVPSKPILYQILD